MEKVLYLEDSYLKEFEAVVTEVNKEKYIVLDKTAFYPSSGGQPHDTGIMDTGDLEFKVVFVGKFDGKISHEIDKTGLKVGDKVSCKIDWERRYKLMRMHTATHIIAAIIYKECGALISGNQLGGDQSRLDFTLENFDREKIQEYIELANEVVHKNIPVKIYFMKKEEAMKIPGIVKLAGALPPDINELRIVEIEGLDIQADGGTHLHHTGEIGHIELTRLENKGKANRRLYFKIS